MKQAIVEALCSQPVTVAPFNYQGVKFSVEATSEKALEKAIIAYLEGRGYTVMTFGKWETPGQICKRLGICYDTLRRRLRSRGCPPVEIDRTRGCSRMSHIRLTPEAERFVLSGKTT